MVVQEEEEQQQGQYSLKCKICGDRFIFKKEETTMFSKWIDHIRSHYVTQREYDAYVNALYRIRNEESVIKSKGRLQSVK